MFKTKLKAAEGDPHFKKKFDSNEVSHGKKSATSFQNTNYLLKFVIYRSLLLGHPTP